MGRVVVTGLGVVSALGNGVADNLHNLRAGRTGIGKAIHLDSSFTERFLFGEVHLSNAELRTATGLRDTRGLTRTELLAISAFNEAVGDAAFTKEDLSDFDTALVSATTVGGMVETEAIHGDANTHTEPSEFVNCYRSGAHTLELARMFGIRGYTDTINTACSSSANAIMLGARLIRAGRARRAIVGGVDSLSRYTVNGFNALQIFSDEMIRPFDEHRKGLNLGEGAAYLVLEREEDAEGKRTYGEVRGYGNANDAYHPSSMSPDAVGVRGAISGALQTAGLAPSDIDHINAHGTGTQNNDYTELLGLSRIFGQVPPFVSTKSFTGHTLAAAGAMEAVFSLLSIAHGEIYPSLNFATPIADFGIAPQTVYRSGAELRHVLSNSFGFGGNCSSLIFSKV
ncbi:MAG: beta-ketoacyl-[acyl-carrier-protein] synthase family protein [Flavobacteriales bacterium]|nr:beta-ketoacyl-[acyl-carrier-protein] synthase family protein [Flavobacteriales bacterium]